MTRQHSYRAFTLIEIMIVIAIIGIVVAIVATTWLRQREVARARACQETLSKIDLGKESYAHENHVPDGAAVGWGDLIGSTLYIKRTPHCPAGGEYRVGVIGQSPTCSYSLPSFMRNSAFQHKLVH